MPAPQNINAPPSPTSEQESADFSYVVSHDLGNCFRQISGFLSLLEDELGTDLTPRQKSYIDRVCEASKAGRAMLDELLIFSRIQKRPLSLADCDATALAKDALMLLTREIGESGARFDIEALGRVPADPELLRDIFRRVFDNAITFHRVGAVPQVHVTVAPDDRDWIVHVEDDGLGVPAGQVENIFRMFHRLDPGRVGAGVGSGLTICRRMARLHAGEVIVRTAERGACVEIRLPKSAVQQG
jgi:chemotaxis family two-component system sensor kinase Cph1